MKIGWKGKTSVVEPNRTFVLVYNWKMNKADGISRFDKAFLGKEIAGNLRSMSALSSGDKAGPLSRYSLKNRIYLGPTSTDHELAFLMVNQALVTKGDFVLDPFVGSGSILVAASHFG